MQYTFKRYEIKYMVTKKQAEYMEAALANHMRPDRFDTYWVQNIYFDTDNWDVVRTSIERPLYKEKLRLRCYNVSAPQDDIFLELKKKYAGIVYKRRVSLPLSACSASLEATLADKDTQISRELDFYLQSNSVTQKMLVTYRRKAFIGIDEPRLRITFDSDVKYRQSDLNFFTPEKGTVVLSEDYVLIEVKTPTSIPLWLAQLFSENGIFKTSYSKYGTCYIDYQEGRTASSEGSGTGLCPV